MSNCRYCGKPAGFLHGKHKECETAHVEGMAKLTKTIALAFQTTALPEDLPQVLQRISDTAFISKAAERSQLIVGWAQALELMMEHGVPSESQEQRLSEFREQFGLTQDDLNQSGAYERMVRACVLREVMHGQISKRCNVQGQIPVNLQKGEQAVWAFPRTQYLEDRTRREYVGRSSGVSVRIAKGVYLRSGAFRGQPVDRTVRQHVDSGTMLVTDRNLYFAGPQKSLRVPYAKVVSFQPYSDGLGIVRDAATAKPQVFVTGDGWFTYNLVSNLAGMASKQVTP